MKDNLEREYQELIQSFSEKDQVRALALLNACKFSDPNDPFLASLKFQKLLFTCSSKSVTKQNDEGILHRLDNILLRLENWKVRNLILSWILCVFVGVSITIGLLFIKGYVRPEFIELNELGLNIAVDKRQNQTWVYFDNEPYPEVSSFRDSGRPLFVFKR